jgi:prophage regulatory protein
MTQTISRLLRLPDVKSATGLSKSTIYARMSEGNFPKQISIGPRLVVWLESDIQQWINDLAKSSF